MRRIALISLCVVTSMVAAPVALASDDSVRQVVREQAARQITQDAKFKSAVKKINSRAAAKKARTATILQQRSVDTFRNAVRAEQADTEQVKAGRNQLLKGLLALQPRPRQAQDRAHAGHQDQRPWRCRVGASRAEDGDPRAGADRQRREEDRRLARVVEDHA